MNPDRRTFYSDGLSAAVLEAVSYDEPRTVMDIARAACGTESWVQRGNVRNRLYDLEAQGLIVSSEGRPMRFTRTRASSTPAERFAAELEDALGPKPACTWPECLPATNDPRPYCTCLGRTAPSPVLATIAGVERYRRAR